MIGYSAPLSLLYVFISNLLAEETLIAIVHWLSVFPFNIVIESSSVLFPLLSTSIGSSATLVSLKVYFSRSMIVGNSTDVYLFGVLAVLMNWFVVFCCFGGVLCSFLFYLFLHRLELFLLVPPLPEHFPSFSQSLTLSNRLSINVLSGSLLIELLNVAVRFFLDSDLFLFWNWKLD